LGPWAGRDGFRVCVPSLENGFVIPPLLSVAMLIIGILHALLLPSAREIRSAAIRRWDVQLEQRMVSDQGVSTY
jgi:hypothetical protein